MTKEELKQGLVAIEEDIKKICVKFEGIFMGHGLVKGEPDNFWQVIGGTLQLYDQKMMDLKELLESWSYSYTEKAKILVRYVNEIREQTNEIYSEDEKAEEIVKRLEGLSTKKEKKVEKKILHFSRSIKQKCKGLMETADLLQDLINGLNKHAQELNDKLAKQGTNLEQLKKSELKYAKLIRERMIWIGERGWKIVCSIYSEDKKAEHIFKRIKSHFLT